MKNSRELQDSESDLAQHRRQKAAIEDQLLEVMVNLDGANTALAQRQAEMSRLAAEWETQQAALRAEQAALEAAAR